MRQILIVGQTPPPYGGQAIMIEKILARTYGDLQLHHVRMAFSEKMGDMGKLRLEKFVELARVIGQILSVRFRTGAKVMYYPPAGPERVPVYRDILILLATRWAFEKVIFHFHAGGLTDILPRLSRLERILFGWAYGRPDAVIRMTEITPEDGSLIGAQREFIVPYGIADATAALPAAPRQQATDVPVELLFVGVLRKSKGVELALDACRLLKERGLGFHLSLMGNFESPAYEQQLRAFVEQHQLQAHVTFLGVRTGTEKYKAFERADIFCFPTFFEAEAFPVVLVEAQCFGLPVVSTHWRGVPAVVEDTQNALLVPPHDAEAVAAALARLIEDPALRCKMGQHSRQRYLEHFTEDRYWANIEAVFEAVV